MNNHELLQIQEELQNKIRSALQLSHETRDREGYTLPLISAFAVHKDENGEITINEPVLQDSEGIMTNAYHSKPHNNLGLRIPQENSLVMDVRFLPVGTEYAHTGFMDEEQLGYALSPVSEEKTISVMGVVDSTGIEHALAYTRIGDSIEQSLTIPNLCLFKDAILESPNYEGEHVASNGRDVSLEDKIIDAAMDMVTPYTPIVSQMNLPEKKGHYFV